ncbi:short-subunit dehydrogenase [Halospina denitrificans]|uniref:Short-subunit dehydrogenase n=1 Tax=Halospina denitrificans TaxID=332522 RepID=A0A4R7JJG0_9GAMM|nr:SDR family oxidoreductase [Halospina denitrificans]TDT37063.1 short-subunit dehydrogenase [Halospina denitrificans]
MTQHIVITGANRGIGLELARQWQQRGDTVTAICRAASDDLRALGVNVIEGVDVTDDISIGKARRNLEGQRIDLLYNNAGLLTDENLSDMNWDRIQTQFEVNTLGPLKMTNALLDLIPDGGKIIVMTSRMGSIGDNDSGGRYGYRLTKAALNAAAKSLALDLKPRGIPVGIFHPGYVQTDMTGHTGHITPAEAAERLIQRADELDLEKSGTFRHSDGSELPW